MNNLLQRQGEEYFLKATSAALLEIREVIRLTLILILINNINL